MSIAIGCGVLFQEVLNGTEITGKIFPVVQFILGDLGTDFEGNAIAIKARRTDLIRNTVNIETIFFFGWYWVLKASMLAASPCEAD